MKKQNLSVEERLAKVENKLNWVLGFLIGLGVVNGKQFVNDIQKPALIMINFLTNIF